ncbi:MAG: ABC transporter substrate-binding protein [Patescibacteria group bacterium]
MPTTISDLENFFLSSKKIKKEAQSASITVKQRIANKLPTKSQLRHLPKVLSSKEKSLILILFLISIISLITIPFSTYYHFTKSVPDYGGELTEGLVGSPKHINPTLAQSNDVDKDLTNLIYSGLVKYDVLGKIKGDLAESYTISEDGLTYTFKLRNNLKWHDNKPLTADDVVFTILTTQNADYSSSQRILWQGVEVDKIDDLTVIFKLKNKYAQFIANATLGILPKHIWENIKPVNFGLSEFNLKPIGSGPYKFSKIRRDTLGNVKSYEIASFDKYHLGKPYISKIIFKFYSSENVAIEAYNNNDVDGLGVISAQNLNLIHFLGQLKTKRLNLPRYFAIFFNQNHSKQLSDKNVRLSLNYATNKQELINKILSNNGKLVTSPMMPGIIDIPDSIPKHEYNIELANKLLEDGGWKYPVSSSDNIRIRQKSSPAPKNKNEKPGEPNKLEIRLTTSDWPELVSVANEIKKQWEVVGVNILVEILPLPELQQAIKEREYDALLFGEVLALDPDPFSFWHSSQKRDPGLNLALYDNNNADKLLEDARQILDRSARISKYDDFQKIVVQDMPAIFLYSPDYLYAQPIKIKGNDTTSISIPADRFDNINEWYIETKRSKK